MTTKTLLILSGGMDSATLAYWHLARGDSVAALSFDYGQRHKKELECAQGLCQRLGIHHQVITIDGFAENIPGSSLTDKAIETPVGHYADENMKKTVVPSRNAIMLSIAFGLAVANEFDTVSFGAHAGDHTIYPDCRRPFIDALEEALNRGVWSCGLLALEAPFLTLSKIDIVRLGDNLGVPYEDTWTCYADGEDHCGQCGACQERKEAFAKARVQDPTHYTGELAFHGQ